MEIFERETVRRKPVGTIKLMTWIILTVLVTNACIRWSSTLPAGLNAFLSLAVLITGMSLVWRMVSKNGESFTYKINGELFIVERSLGRSNMTYFNVRLEQILEIRVYNHELDRQLPGKRRFTVTRQKLNWRVVRYGEDANDKLIIEPSSRFESALLENTPRKKVKP